MKTKFMVTSDWTCAGTGFSEELRNIVYRLAQGGEYEIYWIGYNYLGYDIDLPDTVFPDLKHIGATVKCLSGTGPPQLYGLEGFKREYERYSPDFFMSLGDPNNFLPYIKYRHVTNDRFPYIGYSTLDGLPIHPSWSEIFKGLNVSIAMTEWALRFANNKMEKRKIRRHFGISDDTVLFIDWNTNQHRKRDDALLRCWKEFHPERKNAKLFLYKDSDMSGTLGWHLPALIEQLDVPRETIIFPEDLPTPLGRRKFWERAEAPDFHKKIVQMGDVLVSCTSGEGFGKVFLEGLSLGMPVIVTKTAAVQEVCEKGAILISPYDGQAGKFRWPDRHRTVYGDVVNEERFVEAMLRMYDNPSEREELGAQGREWAKEFDYDTQIIPGWEYILGRIDPYAIMTEEMLRGMK
jgi:glycosyltransferase involved in cell wall biosynthesis